MFCIQAFASDPEDIAVLNHAAGREPDDEGAAGDDLAWWEEDEARAHALAARLSETNASNPLVTVTEVH